MYGVKLYIEPEDIFNKLSEEDKNRFKKCVFDNAEKMPDGTVEITCLLFENEETINNIEDRFKLEL